jgi:hypothetical protein
MTSARSAVFRRGTRFRSSPSRTQPDRSNPRNTLWAYPPSSHQAACRTFCGTVETARSAVPSGSRSQRWAHSTAFSVCSHSGRFGAQTAGGGTTGSEEKACPPGLRQPSCGRLFEPPPINLRTLPPLADPERKFPAGDGSLRLYALSELPKGAASREFEKSLNFL